MFNLKPINKAEQKAYLAAAEYLKQTALQSPTGQAVARADFAIAFSKLTPSEQAEARDDLGTAIMNELEA